MVCVKVTLICLILALAHVQYARANWLVDAYEGTKGYLSKVVTKEWLESDEYESHPFRRTLNYTAERAKTIYRDLELNKQADYFEQALDQTQADQIPQKAAEAASVIVDDVQGMYQSRVRPQLRKWYNQLKRLYELERQAYEMKHNQTSNGTNSDGYWDWD